MQTLWNGDATRRSGAATSDVKGDALDMVGFLNYIYVQATPYNGQTPRVIPTRFH